MITSKIYIIYVHGFRSSGDSSTVKYLKKYLKSPFEIISNDYYHDDPLNVLVLINYTIDEIRKKDKNGIIILVGTSLGGFFVNNIHNVYRIMINPVLNIENIKQYINTNFTYYNKRKNIDDKFINISSDVFKEYEYLFDNQFKYNDNEDNAVTFGMFGTDDSVLNDADIFNKYYSNKIIYKGGHQLSEDNIKNDLLPVINKIILMNKKYLRMKI